MFDVKGVDIKIEIPVLEDFNTIKDRCNLILDGMLLMPGSHAKQTIHRSSFAFNVCLFRFRATY